MSTRAEIAAIVARRLRSLATDAGLSTTASGDQTEGDYTDAIDAALRAIGAIDADTDLPDVTLVTSANLDAVLAGVTREMLTQLQLHYATLTDIRVGDREEKLSQIGAALAAISTGAGTTRGKIVMRSLNRYADDYEFTP